MAKKKTYKVGDKIIDCGQVYSIFKICRQKNSEGEFERVIYFRPYYRGVTNSGVVCSIPLNNIEKTGIRKPLTLEEFELLLVKLKKGKILTEYSDISATKELLKENNPTSDIILIRTLWEEKKDRSEDFSKNKRDILDLVVDRFAQEYSIVKGLSLEKAKEKVYLILQG